MTFQVYNNLIISLSLCLMYRKSISKLYWKLIRTLYKDALRGQAICLYVVPREGETIDKKALRQYLIGRIAPYKVPREYFLVESLPKTALGKVRKNVLRDETVAILSKNKFAGRAL